MIESGLENLALFDQTAHWGKFNLWLTINQFIPIWCISEGYKTSELWGFNPRPVGWPPLPPFNYLKALN